MFVCTVGVNLWEADGWLIIHLRNEFDIDILVMHYNGIIKLQRWKIVALLLNWRWGERHEKEL